MKTFKDRFDRSWDIEVHGGTITRVHSLTGYLLTNYITVEGNEELAKNPVRLLAVLFACCKAQADERKIDADDFIKGIGGDAMDAAITALQDEVIAFSPPSSRPGLRLLAEKTKALKDEAGKKMVVELEKMDPAEVLANVLGKNSGTLLASSASTPPVSLSEVSD